MTRRGPARVGETVLEDVRVIAMGRRLNADGGEEAGAGQSSKTATLRGHAPLPPRRSRW